MSSGRPDDHLKVGSYVLSKTLGIGSFGKVKYAEHERTRHPVAIKILNRAKIRKLDMQEKVRREIHNLRMLEFPHVCRLYDVIYTPSDIFVVMEYLPGGELFDYIVNSGRLHEAQARAFFQQILCGVEYCHQKQVVHRDLKPENLLLDASGQTIKIADFGLSNVMEDGTFLRTSCGSPNYAAPEVISGSLYAGPEVDVWSCGVILYALLAGSLPFDDESIPNLFKKIQGGMYNLPTHLSPGSRDLISRMLKVDPIRRITVASIRKHPWFQDSLPRYLSIAPADLPERDPHRVDPDAAAQLATLGFSGLSSADAVTAALRSATPRHRDLRVIHELIVDERRRQRVTREIEQARTEATKRPRSDSVSSGAGAGAGSAMSTPTAGVGFMSTPAPPPVPGVVGSHAVAGAAIPPGSRFATMPGAAAAGGGGSLGGIGGPAAATAAAAAAAAEAAQRIRRRWYLGIQSKKDPIHVMNEVYRALTDGGFEYQLLGPYRVRCRWAPPHIPEPKDSDFRVKIGLQLYRIQKGIYLLDLHKVRGDAFSFMNLCARIIAELKVPPAARLALQQAAAAGGMYSAMGGAPPSAAIAAGSSPAVARAMGPPPVPTAAGFGSHSHHPAPAPPVAPPLPAPATRHPAPHVMPMSAMNPTVAGTVGGGGGGGGGGMDLDPSVAAGSAPGVVAAPVSNSSSQMDMNG